MAEKVTAETIKKALRDRFCQPEWATFFEVGSGTGAHCRRHADALAMNMYPSRGLSLLGFEVKVSRADLKKELEQPDKAEEIAQFCNEWWLAVPQGLVREDDLVPAAWGIMEFKNGKMVVKKKALLLDGKDFTREFVAALLRSANKMAEGDMQAAMEPKIVEAVEHRMSCREWEIKKAKEDLQRLQDAVNEFNKATGANFSYYTDIDRLAERLKIAESYEKLTARYGGLRSIQHQMQQSPIYEGECAGYVRSKRSEGLRDECKACPKLCKWLWDDSERRANNA